MSANTETTGAPEGYAPCPNTPCSRWMHPKRASCVMCTWGELRGKPDSMFARMMAKEPDWTPPIAAPAAHVERRKGQLWRHVAKSPPAQEAPLPFSFTDDEGREHRFAAGVERDTASRAYWSWMAEQTGKPYAGPERLPRPQLAADWAWDCLPESDR